MAEIELAEARAGVVAIDDVAMQWETILGGVRTRILALPTKVAPLVAHETDQSLCKVIIQDGPSENLPQGSQTNVEATQSLTQVFQNTLKKLSPPPKLKISEWADLERKLSPEASAEPGQWQTWRAPDQRDIIDAMCYAAVETVVFMWGAQVRTTELLLNAIDFLYLPRSFADPRSPANAINGAALLERSPGTDDPRFRGARS